ncbi:MAG: glycosyltransferase family 2 protein [Bacteroidota bacterium]|jgi:glycosyltransferase involved in cell wall biosynthesis
MNFKPRFSIITPSFNQGIYIRDTIESILQQDYNNFEHIIVDGGSTDETIAILKEYKHLKWVSEKDNGQSNAINKGFTMATGDIIGWLNSDDYYEKNIFNKISQHFNQNPACNLLYGDITYVDLNKIALFSIKGPIITYEKLLANPDLIRQPSTFWRATLLSRIGNLNENLHLVMDYDYILRILEVTSPWYYNANLSYFRTYRTNKTNSNPRKQAKELFYVMRQHSSHLSVKQHWFLLLRYINYYNSIFYISVRWCYRVVKNIFDE